MIDDLRRRLDAAWASDRPHSEKVAVAAAIISAVLHEAGMQATLVGGGAIEVHASEVYTTSDLDLIVEGKTRADLDAVLTRFGFVREGRHWVRGELFVEVPGNWMPDPVDVISVDDLPLRVVRKEVVLADRIIGFKHWQATAFGAQAIALLALFRGTLDEATLRERVKREDAEDALAGLSALASSGAAVTEESLQALLTRLHSAKTSS